MSPLENINPVCVLTSALSKHLLLTLTLSSIQKYVINKPNFNSFYCTDMFILSRCIFIIIKFSYAIFSNLYSLCLFVLHEQNDKYFRLLNQLKCICIKQDMIFL